MIKNKNYIFSEVSAKTALNINTIFNKDIHDAMMYKFKIGSLSNEKDQEIVTKNVVESNIKLIYNCRQWNY